MIKEFCKKCYGKLFCVEQEPQMNSNEIISNILKNLTQKKRARIHKIIIYFFPSILSDKIRWIFKLQKMDL